MQRLKLGIIGLGRIGQLHAHNIIAHVPEFELTAGYDPLVENAFWSSTGVSKRDSAQALIEDDDLNAVLIASPSDTHAQLIQSAAQCKKHVFCEKPIGIHEKEILEAIEVLQQHNIKFQLGFNRRFDPNFQSLISRLRVEDCAKPHVVKISSRDPSMPSLEYCQQSGGIFMDMTIHDFDMARFIMREEVVEVYAQGKIWHQAALETYGDFDTVIVHLKFENGSIGIIDNSRQAAYGYDQRIEVYDNRRVLLAENVLNDAIEHWTESGLKRAPPRAFFIERYQQAYQQQLKSFYQAISQDKEPKVGYQDGLQAYRIAQAALQSVQTSTPVKVSQGI